MLNDGGMFVSASVPTTNGGTVTFHWRDNCSIHVYTGVTGKDVGTDVLHQCGILLFTFIDLRGHKHEGLISIETLKGMIRYETGTVSLLAMDKYVATMATQHVRQWWDMVASYRVV